MLTMNVQFPPARPCTPCQSGTAGRRLYQVAGTLAHLLVRRMDERQWLMTLGVRESRRAKQAVTERPDSNGVSKGILLVLLIIGSLITVVIGPSA